MDYRLVYKQERLDEALMLWSACLYQTNNQRDRVQIHTWRHGEYVCAKWVLIFPNVEMCLQHGVPVQITRVGQCWRDGCQNKLWDSFHFQQDLELEAPTWTGGHLQTSARLCDFGTYKVVVLHATSTLNREETLTHILQRWILAF